MNEVEWITWISYWSWLGLDICPAGIYLLKVNNRNNSVSIVNFGHVIAGWVEWTEHIEKIHVENIY